MIQVFNKHLKEITNFSNKTVYLAISGGIDSIVLSNLLLESGIKHTLLHCNFKLRAGDSEMDEQFVINYAKKNELKYFVKHFETEKLAREQKITIQECARNLRYDWFNTFLEDENSILLTAHHLDDSIETFFINILRGTGLKGLKGITNKNKVVRPLLKFSKSEIIEFAKNNNIDFREDISNKSDKYLRNNLRHHTIPKLKELDNDLLKKMGTLLSEISEIDSYLDLQVKHLKKGLTINESIPISQILDLPVFLLTRLFNDYGITRKNVTEFIKVINGKSGTIFITHTHQFLNSNNTLVFELKKDANPILKKLTITENTEINIDNESYLRFTYLNSKDQIRFSNNTAHIDISMHSPSFTVRNWSHGDKIMPLGMKGSKLVSDLLLDKKINRLDKEKVLVIENKNEIIWVVNHTVSEKFKIRPSSVNILKIEYLKY